VAILRLDRCVARLIRTRHGAQQRNDPPRRGSHFRFAGAVARAQLRDRDGRTQRGWTTLRMHLDDAEQVQGNLARRSGPDPEVEEHRFGGRGRDAWAAALQRCDERRGGVNEARGAVLHGEALQSFRDRREAAPAQEKLLPLHWRKAQHDRCERERLRKARGTESWHRGGGSSGGGGGLGGGGGGLR
jgi:hypothetical protein